METRWALPLLVALSLVVACGERPPSSPSPLADRAATPLSPLDADAQVAINFGRSIAADDEGTLHVVWFEDEGGPGSVWHRRSPDGGQTWEAPRHVADVFQPQGTAVVAAAGAYVYVAWHDFTGGNPDIRLQRSTDRRRDLGGAIHPSRRLRALRVPLSRRFRRTGAGGLGGITATASTPRFTRAARATAVRAGALPNGFRARRTNPGCQRSR